MTKRRTAPEIIGFHFGMDMRDVSDGRYQPTRYAAPAVYVLGDDYYCAPSSGQRPPAGFEWREIATHYGRPVYEASPGTASD